MTPTLTNCKTSDRWEAAYLMCAGLKLVKCEMGKDIPPQAPRIFFILQGEEVREKMEAYSYGQATVELRQFKMNYSALTNIINAQRRGEGVTDTRREIKEKDSSQPD